MLKKAKFTKNAPQKVIKVKNKSTDNIDKTLNHKEGCARPRRRGRSPEIKNDESEDNFDERIFEEEIYSDDNINDDKKDESIFVELDQPIVNIDFINTLKEIAVFCSSSETSHNGIPDNFEKIYEAAQGLHETFLKTLTSKLIEENAIVVPSNFVSPNNLQDDRFPEVDLNGTKSIRFIPARLMVLKLLEFYEECLKNTKTYIRGPKGIGKSHLVLLLVWFLRSNPKNRVLYIHNPELCRKYYWRYIRNEIVYYLFNNAANNDLNLPAPPINTRGRNEIEQWFNYITNQNDHFQAITSCLNKMINHFNANSVKVYFIIDQEDVIQRLARSGDTSEREFTDRFFMIFGHDFCDSKILAASENNEHYKIRKDTPEKYFSKLLNLKDSISLIKKCLGAFYTNRSLVRGTQAFRRTGRAESKQV